MELRLLQYFLTVAREGNISRAAEALHITQPTLSRQMTLLEEQLGVRLFLRNSRPLALTGEGLLLLRRAEEILDLVERTEAELAAQEYRMEGTVSIGSGELASARLLAQWVADFSARYPRVSFELYTAGADQIRRRMDDGLTDIGLLLEPVDLERYEYIRMPVKERWAALMPSGAPLAKRSGVTAGDLAGVPVILPQRQKIQDVTANWFGDGYERLQVAAVSNLSTNSALLVQAGLGYALTLEGALPFLEPSQVRLTPLRPELTSTSVLAWKRGLPFSTAVSCFLRFVKCSLGMKEELEKGIRQDAPPAL